MKYVRYSLPRFGNSYTKMQQMKVNGAGWSFCWPKIVGVIWCFGIWEKHPNRSLDSLEEITYFHNSLDH